MHFSRIHWFSSRPWPDAHTRWHIRGNNVFFCWQFDCGFDLIVFREFGNCIVFREFWCFRFFWQLWNSLFLWQFWNLWFILFNIIRNVRNGKISRREWEVVFGLWKFWDGVRVRTNSSSKVNIVLVISRLNQLSLAGVHRFLNFIKRVCIWKFKALFNIRRIFGGQFNFFTSFEFNRFRQGWALTIDERESITGQWVIVLIYFDGDIFEIKDCLDSEFFLIFVIVDVHER